MLEREIKDACLADSVRRRASMLFEDRQESIYRGTDRLFAWIMLAQWAAVVCFAFLTGQHGWIAMVASGAISCPPIALAWRFPGQPFTRYIVASAQMLMSALFIQLTAGRVEARFHLFVSLAVLALYRDWRVFVPATLVIAADQWQPVPWVLFESAFLIRSCGQSIGDMKDIAQQRAELEATHQIIEGRVRDRSVELEHEMTERKTLEGQLVQAQKLESIGQLAAGIAHEINTPIQYVSDNTRFLKESFCDIERMVTKYRGFLEEVKNGPVPKDRVSEVEAAALEADLPYLLREIPKAIDQSIEGLIRVADIVRAMKEFSHPDSTEKEYANINHAIENTLAVCRNEFKYIADVVTKLDPELPTVRCLVGEFSQVILNLVVNAAHAIASAKRGAGEQGKIEISTRRDGRWAEIRVRDNGTGIPQSVQPRIFTPFFTTKQVGKGTGQGLYLARTVIVKKHGGMISFETAESIGTTFIVRLLIDGAQTEEAA